MCSYGNRASAGRTNRRRRRGSDRLHRGSARRGAPAPRRACPILPQPKEAICIRLPALAATVAIAAIPTAQTSRPTTTTALVTAYCQTGRTASGIETKPGIVATRSAIPFGTVVHISGTPLGNYRVEDRMASTDLASDDLYTPRCSDAIRWGIRREHVRTVGKAR